MFAVIRRWLTVDCCCATIDNDLDDEVANASASQVNTAQGLSEGDADGDGSDYADEEQPDEEN